MTLGQKISLTGLDSLMERLQEGHTGLDQLINFLQNLEVQVELPEVNAQDIELKLIGTVLQIRRRNNTPLTETGVDEVRVIAENAKSRVALGIAEKVAPTEGTVIICGATGTGKDLFARTIHRFSRHKGKPFVWLPGGELAGENLHRKLIEYLQAVGAGTLFLDEVEDIDLAAHGLLLDFFQKPRSYRIIASTSQDLDKLVKNEEFSAELSAFLHDGYIELVELKDRREDIQPLARYHMDRLCRNKGIAAKVLSPEYLHLLEIYSWPGNVRELVNTLEQSLLIAREKKTLFAKDLPSHIRIRTIKTAAELKKGL